MCNPPFDDSIAIFYFTLLQARNDLKLSVSHNLQNKAAKLGFTHDRKINGKKTTFKVNYLTKTKGINGEVISQLAPNKKATVTFTDKQVCAQGSSAAF